MQCIVSTNQVKVVKNLLECFAKTRDVIKAVFDQAITAGLGRKEKEEERNIHISVEFISNISWNEDTQVAYEIQISSRA